MEILCNAVKDTLAGYCNEDGYEGNVLKRRRNIPTDTNRGHKSYCKVQRGPPATIKPIENKIV